MKKYDIERMQQQISLETLLDRYGWETRQQGRYKMVLCKFHNDNQFGSAVIFPNSPNHFMCFACGKRYGIFDVYMYEHSCSFSEALEGLAQEFGIISQEESADIKEMNMPFGRKELSDIGLCLYDRKPELYPMGYVEDDQIKAFLQEPGYRILKEIDNPNPFSIDPEEYDVYVLAKKGKSQMEHMTELFHEDRESFFQIVWMKAKETEKVCMERFVLYRNASVVLEEQGDDTKQMDEKMFAMQERLYSAKKILRILKRLNFRASFL